MLRLYSTLGCHLCEQALYIVGDCIDSETKVDVVDIADDNELMENYGLRIPVIKDLESNQEIAWPFSEHEFLQWLKKVRRIPVSVEKIADNGEC